MYAIGSVTSTAQSISQAISQAVTAAANATSSAIAAVQSGQQTAEAAAQAAAQATATAVATAIAMASANVTVTGMPQLQDIASIIEMYKNGIKTFIGNSLWVSEDYCGSKAKRNTATIRRGCLEQINSTRSGLIHLSSIMPASYRISSPGVAKIHLNPREG